MPEPAPRTTQHGLSQPFDKVLRNFGTSAPQIATVVAIVLGSLQFDEFFNAGAWTVVAILMFSLVYLYRRQVSHSLSRATTYVLLFLAMAAIPPIILFRSLTGETDLAGWLRTHQILGTAYASAVISLSLAVLLTSYAQQEQVHGMAFPAALGKAIAKQITASQFYKSNVYFEITPIEVTAKSVILDLLMTYNVTNRTNEPCDWGMHFRLSDPDGQFLEASFDGHSIDTTSPDYRIGRGIKVPCPLGPKKTGRVRFKVRQHYRHKDFEMLTSYTPATDIKAVVVDLPGITFDIEALYYRKNHIERKNGRQVISLEEGILPFQGLRLNWEVNR